MYERPIGTYSRACARLYFSFVVLPLLVQLRVSYADDVSCVGVVGSQNRRTELQLLVGGGID